MDSPRNLIETIFCTAVILLLVLAVIYSSYIILATVASMIGFLFHAALSVIGSWFVIRRDLSLSSLVL